MLAANVAGYTRLMEADGETTLSSVLVVGSGSLKFPDDFKPTGNSWVNRSCTDTLPSEEIRYQFSKLAQDEKYKTLTVASYRPMLAGGSYSSLAYPALFRRASDPRGKPEGEPLSVRGLPQGLCRLSVSPAGCPGSHDCV